MLNPEQAGRLRSLPLSDKKKDTFDNYDIEILAVNVPEFKDDDKDTIEEDPMYKPEMIFGTPEHPSCLDGVGNFTVHTKTPCFTKHNDARIVGFCGFLTHDNVLYSASRINQKSKEYFIQMNQHYNHHGFAFVNTDDQFIIKFVSRPEPVYRNFDALFLLNIEPGNYGSFAFRLLPQILLAAHQNIEFDCYIVADRMPWVLDAIRLAGLPNKPIFSTREVCGDIFKSVTVASHFDAEAFLNTTIRKLINGFTEKVVSAHALPADPQKIYVSRSLSSLHRPRYRVMQNERYVEDTLQKIGFNIVYPETLPFTQQILTFWNASHIIGPSGSGMFNSIFAKPPISLVDIETFHYTVRQHAKLYASCQMRYAFLFCKTIEFGTQPPVHRSYEVPPDLLDESVKWLLSQ